MAGWDSILEGVKSVGRFVSGDSYGAYAVRIAALTALSRKLKRSIDKDNQEPLNLQDFKAQGSTLGTSVNTPLPDTGTRLQLNPDTNNKIPVLYGSATFGGDIIDVRLEDNNHTLYAALVLTEVTGRKLSDDKESEYTLNEVFVNGERMLFNNDGVSCNYTIDTEGNRSNTYKDRVKVYFYGGGRAKPQTPEYYTNNALQNADQIMPKWTTRHTMENLVFAIVRVTYDRERGIEELPEFKFAMSNSMRLPGDVMYDYMTNTRYGAGLSPDEISIV